MWLLMLNDMRWPKFEVTGPVAWAEHRSDLEALLAREKVAPYLDDIADRRGDFGRWRKGFRKGGPLEWYNQPPHDLAQAIVPVPEKVMMHGIVYRSPEVLIRDDGKPALPHVRELDAVSPTLPATAGGAP